MNDTSHTPAPWEVSSLDGRTIHAPDGYRTDAKGTERIPKWLGVATVVQRDAYTTEANARLIAAAPDLLAALRDAMDAVETYHENVGSKSTGDTLAACRAAIAKAEGRP